MIRVTFYETSDHVIKRCVMEGHADYADRGKDIVCSAVSMLFINTVNCIEELAKEPYHLDTDKKKNRYDFSFVAKEPNHDARLLMDSLYFGLVKVHVQYGSEYLKITLKEVQVI